jgi:hypothetical protein
MLADFDIYSDRAALRYYRLDRFPSSVSKKQIEQGKALWSLIYSRKVTTQLLSKKEATKGRSHLVQASQPPKLPRVRKGQAPQSSRLPTIFVNRRGLFNWERWDGRDWNTASLRTYSHDLTVLLAKQAMSSLLKVLDFPSSSAHCRPITESLVQSVNLRMSVTVVPNRNSALPMAMLQRDIRWQMAQGHTRDHSNLVRG